MLFRLYTLQFRFTAEGPLHFPAGHAANLIRGRLGAVLRHISCPPSCPNPAECPQPGACAYARLFSPRASGTGPSGLADWPRPFVLRVAHLEGAAIPEGSAFHFGVHLFDLRPGAVAALESAFAQLGRDGLGPARTPATLTGIEGAAEPLCIQLDLPLDSPVPSTTRIAVSFLTPTDLKGAPATPGPLPLFHLLAARIRDRLSTLRALYGDGPLPIDFREFGRRAERIRTAGGAVRQVAVHRRSRSTGQTHSIGGFVGRVEYEGDLSEFVPYLQAAAFTGVGRQTVWGKGQIAVEILAPPQVNTPTNRRQTSQVDR